ncbi:MAG: AMP-dependent synthetase, partial [Cellvibrionales bacterium TMED148]
FSLSSGQHGHVSNCVDPESGDAALILHTSGTTSRPKIVPLTHSNLVNSAANIQQALELSESDKCMNIMPLFHIHGLIGTVLSSIASGASVWCSAGFSALKFYQLLDEVKPTWYSAVPTMHQTILARSERNKTVIENSSLRLIRSSSASLPGPVMRQLSQTFGVPVIESYGMTEATHQMTSNPLTNGPQKPGSVGIPAGPDVAVADPVKNRLINGVGEIVISGKNVTPGYEGNASANEQAFFYASDKRWFRTGDEGRFDKDGYLILTGRLKEIINRGGEKIGPLEVDGVISSHSDVLQVVTFAIPHPTLGEEVGAAIVLKDGAKSAENDIKAFCASSLSAFKIPSKIVFVDEIPKGATGKLQRIGLAEKLNLT